MSLLSNLNYVSYRIQISKMRVIGILLILLIISLASSKMVYMTELFRHGARYPISNIWDGKDTKASHGQLLGMGMRQHYLLGTYLGKDYIKQLGLNAHFDESQVQVYSDDSQRCFQSAYAHLAGWFPLGSGEEIPAGLDPSFLEPPFDQSSNLEQSQTVEEPGLNEGYQPIPVLLGHQYFAKCPKEAIIIGERVTAIADKTAFLEAEQQIFLQKIKSIFNLPQEEADVASMVLLYDTVVCDQNLGRKIPERFTAEDEKRLKYIQNYLFVLLYSEHLSKVFSTPILKPALENMEKVIEGKNGNIKLTVVSGHDTTVAPVLTFLNLTSAECVQKKFKNKTVTGNCAEPVPFASSIQMELHQKDSKDDKSDPSSYFVRVRYNGEYYQLCGTTSTQCDYTVFSARVKAHLVDFDKECGIK